MRVFIKTKKFLALKNGGKRSFIEAYITLGIMRAAILAIPFKRLVKSLEQQKDCVAPSLDNTQLITAEIIGKAVQTAANNTPWESACLAQALTAQRMLKKRGIGGIFHLGATLDDVDPKKIKAHAWLQCGNQIITGEAGHNRYAVLSTFSWTGK